jgi:hypothetical protein
MLNPLTLFREAIAKYPKVKGLYAILAALALVVIARSFRVGADYAVFGIIIVFFALVLVGGLAVGATRLPINNVAAPVSVLIWAVLILAIGSMSFLFTGYFFNWPHAIRPYSAGKEPPSLISPARNPIVGRWMWGADPDGRRTQWVTADADGTLESTIVTPGEQPPEKLIDSGKWTVLDENAARYELSWDARGGDFVTRNYVTLSADGQHLI